MVLAKKLTGVVQVGLLGLALLAGPAWTRTVVDEIPGLRVGIRGGGILPSTDLTGKLGPTGGVLVRYGIMRGLEGELSLGYGLYTTEDYAWTSHDATGVQDRTRKRDYKTDLSAAQLRFLYAPVKYERWNPFIYLGAGYEYFNIQNESMTARRGGFSGIGKTLGIPVGIGARRELGAKTGVEINGGYTYTFSDRLDESKDGGGKDGLFELALALTYDLTAGRTVERQVADRVPTPVKPVPAAPAPAPVKPVAPVVLPAGDQDGDGLSDWEETRVYFTNPRMADSDGDGLTDQQEVQVYRTDPNKADSDGGGVNDGIEVQHGTLPLYRGDDVQSQGTQGVGVPGVDITLPVVNFPTGGAVVSAEDRKALDKAAAALKQYPGALVEIRGYTDNVGAPAANLKLSLLRAQAVSDYLAGKGVEAWRLSVVGLGDKNPVAANGTPEGKARNRRAELMLVK